MRSKESATGLTAVYSGISARSFMTERNFNVQPPETGECVSPGPNLQILPLDPFYLT